MKESLGKFEILFRFCISFGVRYIQLSFGMRNPYTFSTFYIFRNSSRVWSNIYFLNMLHNLHHFTYFTTQFSTVLPDLVLDTQYQFGFLFELSSVAIFMISIADAFSARSQEPNFMLHKPMILNLQEVFRPILFFYIAIIFLDTFSLDTKKKRRETRAFSSSL